MEPFHTTVASQNMNDTYNISNDFPPITASSTVGLDDPTLLSALLETPINDDEDEIDEDDEIVREIDVYISPELANTMYLMQFPLQPASHSCELPATSSSFQAKEHKRTRPPPPPQPVSARIKHEHSMIELDYKVPSSSFSSQRQIPGPLNLSQRKFSSHNIPIRTHMAMGLFDNTSSKIDLIPLHRIMQMRPTFAHVDALFQLDTEEEQQQTKEDENKKTLQPLMFKNSESDRAATQRKSSYAYKRASEEAEEWTDLDVHGFGSLARKETMKRAYCPHSMRDVDLKFMRASKAGVNEGYVKSLNYLPSTIIESSAEDFTIDQGHEIADGNTEPDWKRDLTSMVANLFQERGGMPLPYPIFRSRFQASVPDNELIDAISASAVLVRGNFVLKSSLMALSNIYIENARDVILVLMTKHGFIQRARLFKAFQEAGDDMSVMVTMDVINSLLELMGRKTDSGIEMKTDDDTTFAAQFCDVAISHGHYWDQKEAKLQCYIDLYEEEKDITDVDELNKVLFGFKKS